MLWKIDGLEEKSCFLIDGNDFDEAKVMLENDAETLKQLKADFEKCTFFQSLPFEERSKVYNPDKGKYNWRFLYSNGRIRTLSITKLIKHVFKTRGFVNTYRHTSIHIHSNYYAIEEFRRVKGKIVAGEYADPLIRLAIITTAMLIDDICRIDEHVRQLPLPYPVIDFIKGMSNSIRSSPE